MATDDAAGGDGVDGGVAEDTPRLGPPDATDDDGGTRWRTTAAWAR